MAITTAPYNKFMESQVNGVEVIDFNTDDMRVSLHTSSYTPNLDTHDYWDDVTNEISGSGYTTGGGALAAESITLDTSNDFVYFDATDLTWTGLTPAAPFRYGVLYKYTGTAGTSPLVLLIDFGEDVDPAGSDYTLQWALPANGAIIKWQAA